jgi:hypothetical protein
MGLGRMDHDDAREMQRSPGLWLLACLLLACLHWFAVNDWHGVMHDWRHVSSRGVVYLLLSSRNCYGTRLVCSFFRFLIELAMNLYGWHETGWPRRKMCQVYNTARYNCDIYSMLFTLIFSSFVHYSANFRTVWS